MKQKRALPIFLLSLLVLTSSVVMTPVSSQRLRQASSSSIDVYTQRGGSGTNSPSDSFGPGQQVIIYSSVAHEGSPVNQQNITFDVRDPLGGILTFYDATNVSGIAETSFCLPLPGDNPEQFFGVWSIAASADIADEVFLDTLEFEYGYLVEVRSVETGEFVNGEWWPKTVFHFSDSIVVVVNLKTIALSPQNVCLTFTLTDSSDTPALFTCYWHLTQGMEDEVSVNLGVIPSWADPGEATLSIAALTELPDDGGTPFSPQVQRNLTIWWSPADINYDYKVNFYDAVAVSAAYSSTPSDPNWNPHCDIARPRGLINVYDVVIIVASYGEQYTP